jgi:uncharacterized protein
MIRQLQPWYENIGKRQVKAPKIFFRDSGIFHALLNIHQFENLYQHPKLGASWEGFALEEIIRASGARSEDCFFWSTYENAEIDLLIYKSGKMIGIEIKYSDAPSITKSMQIALKDLKLESIYVIYPGDIDYALSDRIMVKGIKNYLRDCLKIK